MCDLVHPVYIRKQIKLYALCHSHRKSYIYNRYGPRGFKAERKPGTFNVSVGIRKLFENNDKSRKSWTELLNINRVARLTTIFNENKNN